LIGGMRSVTRSVREMVGATCLSCHGGGIGDQLMLSTIAHELKLRGCRNVLIVTQYPDLFLGNPDVNGVAIPGSRRAWVFMKLAGERTRSPSYLINYDPRDDTRDPPPEHVLAYMCRMVGITGRVGLRPYLSLSRSQREWGAPYEGCIAVQSSGLGAGYLLLNKQWFPQRFAQVAAHLLKTHPVVQIGNPIDPAVPCTYDIRGKTTLRQLAAVLAHCRMFVGLVGMPMHLARAVECPSVIVYGGRERPDQTGYSCNENIYNPVACAPCWQDSRCDYSRVCMESIPTERAIEAAERLLEKPRVQLEVDSYDILPH
jgi:hypothetical protein